MHEDQEWTQYSHLAAMGVVHAEAIMAHEFGHIGGLGHTRDGHHLMRAGYNRGRLHITAYDESAMEEIYD